VGVVFPHLLSADSIRAAAGIAGVPAMDSLTLLFALDGFEALRLGRKGTDILASACPPPMPSDTRSARLA